MYKLIALSILISTTSLGYSQQSSGTPLNIICGDVQEYGYYLYGIYLPPKNKDESNKFKHSVKNCADSTTIISYLNGIVTTKENIKKLDLKKKHLVQDKNWYQSYYRIGIPSSCIEKYVLNVQTSIPFRLNDSILSNDALESLIKDNYIISNVKRSAFGKRTIELKEK
jgi:hypothetical protein